MAPIRKGDGTPLEIPGVSEVRSGDGRVFFEGDAIPDSALYHYPFLERSNSTVVEELENEDATAQGTTNVSNNWWEGFAEDGDGTDYIEFPQAISDWVAPNNGQSRWLAFTLEGQPSANDNIFSVQDTSPSPSENWRVRDSGSGGDLEIFLSDDNGDSLQVSTNSTVIGATGKHRVVCNLITLDGTTDVEIWVNGSETTTTVDRDGTFNGSFSSNRMDPILFGRTDNGSATPSYDGVVDNVILGQLGTTLSASEIQDDYDVQPWS